MTVTDTPTLLPDTVTVETGVPGSGLTATVTCLIDSGAHTNTFN